MLMPFSPTEYKLEFSITVTTTAWATIAFLDLEFYDSFL